MPSKKTMSEKVSSAMDVLTNEMSEYQALSEKYQTLSEEQQRAYELVLTATSKLAKVIFKAVKGNEKPELLKTLFGRKKANEMIRNILADKYDILDMDEAIINYLEL